MLCTKIEASRIEALATRGKPGTQPCLLPNSAGLVFSTYGFCPVLASARVSYLHGQVFKHDEKRQPTTTHAAQAPQDMQRHPETLRQG